MDLVKNNAVRLICKQKEAITAVLLHLILVAAVVVVSSNNHLDMGSNQWDMGSSSRHLWLIPSSMAIVINSMLLIRKLIV